MNWKRRSYGFFFILLFLTISKRVLTQSPSVGSGIPSGVLNQGLGGSGSNFQQQQNIGPNDNANVFTGTGNNLFYGGILVLINTLILLIKDSF